jgi:hypothetical protein
MTPLEIIRQAQAGTLIDEDGNVVTLEHFPGLSNKELQDFADQVPCGIPPEIAELLGACSGFYGTVEQVEFTGKDLMFEFEQVFPYGLPIAADGYGNLWVVDQHPDTTRWGPIYFACHDAPVILYQADSLEQLLGELFRMFEPRTRALSTMFTRTGWLTCGTRTPGFSPTNNVSGPRTPSSRASQASSAKDSR